MANIPDAGVVHRFIPAVPTTDVTPLPVDPEVTTPEEVVHE